MGIKTTDSETYGLTILVVYIPTFIFISCVKLHKLMIKMLHWIMQSSSWRVDVTIEEEDMSSVQQQKHRGGWKKEENWFSLLNIYIK